MKLPEVIIAENIHGPEVDELKKRFNVFAQADLWKSPDRLRELLPDCRALLIRNQTRVDADLLRNAPALEVIGRAGAGLDNIDLPAANAAGVVVVSTPDQNSISVAELTIGIMLGLARNIPRADRHAKAGGWERHLFFGTELHGKKLGIVGLGRIGFLTAMRARAFGMQILAYDTQVSADSVAVMQSEAELVDLNTLLSQADFISSHVPLLPSTRGFFNYERFCLMKPTAYFVNLSRGEVVDEPDLVRALQEQRIAGAGLDVREREPSPRSALNDFENVILTPHIAAFTHDAQVRVVRAVCNDVAAVLDGHMPVNAVNFTKPGKGR